LVVAFNNHPHSIVVLPNANDTLQVKNADSEKVSVCKVLMQVGLRTIFSDIIRDNLPPSRTRLASMHSATSSAH
jgi:hypothetical protein